MSLLCVELNLMHSLACVLNIAVSAGSKILHLLLMECRAYVFLIFVLLSDTLNFATHMTSLSLSKEYGWAFQTLA